MYNAMPLPGIVIQRCHYNCLQYVRAPCAIVVDLHAPLIGSVANQSPPWQTYSELTGFPLKHSLAADRILQHCFIYSVVEFLYAVYKIIHHTVTCVQCHQVTHCTINWQCTVPPSRSHVSLLQCSVRHCGRLPHAVSCWQCHESEFIVTHVLYLDMLPICLQRAEFCKGVYQYSMVICVSQRYTPPTVYNWL